MKKPVFPRIISLLILYAAVFVILVMVQFTRQRGFTQQVGNFVISGHYGKFPDSKNPLPANEYPLDGEVSIFFGGMEFCLTNIYDNDNLGVLTAGGGKEVAVPVSMTISGGNARFRLAVGDSGNNSGVVELTFSSQFSGGTPELRIVASLFGDYERMELPYRPLRTSRIRHSGDGEFHIIAEGTSYHFTDSSIDPLRRLITMTIQDPVISYGAVPGREALDPVHYIIPSALDKRNYDDILNRWQEQSISFWNRSIEDNPDEETVMAYLAESIRLGNYRAAVSAIPSGFLAGNQRTYESAAFLGQLDRGLRSLAAIERENFTRLSRLINDKSVDFLQDRHVINYFGIRGYGSLFDDGAEIIRSLNPAILDLDLAPGILEGYIDWKLFRPYTDNPFERLADQACFVISEGLRMDSTGDQVLSFYQGEADLEFNLRLGTALTAYGENTAQELWVNLGRSLILSILSRSNSVGAVPTSLLVSDDGSFTASAGSALISAARIYQFLEIGNYYARAVGIGTMANGIWAWTAASSVETAANQDSNMLDISVSFPLGETHYMIIRGIRPFSQLELYNIPFRTDPQFERYDSSGWSYSPSEQTLVLKMKHRLSTEHIRIYY